jgi:hypothetical protein
MHVVDDVHGAAVQLSQPLHTCKAQRTQYTNIGTHALTLTV